jgi:hypothetical protein
MMDHARLRCATTLLCSLCALAASLPEAVELTVRIVGAPETVFSHSRDACNDSDVPDIPAKAFRDESGRVTLLATNHWNRRSIGPDLDSVRRDCSHLILDSHYNPDPAAYDDFQWLYSPYTFDGKSIWSLVHNEYHGNAHGYNMCPSGIYQNCWYNAIVFATSTDGGSHFQHATPPKHLIAEVPYKYVPDSGPHGIFSPSNIIHHKDGYYYFLARTTTTELQEEGVCLFRTSDLTDPKSWRAWNGTDFSVQMINPYNSSGSNDPALHVCAPVQYSLLRTMHESLTYNKVFHVYLLVGTCVNISNEPSECGEPIQQTFNVTRVYGFCYSTSSDLLNWTQPRWIMKVYPSWDCPVGKPCIYQPSLLDPTSDDLNFEQSGDSPYLYYIYHHPKPQRVNATWTWQRDLLRVPLHITKGQK